MLRLLRLLSCLEGKDKIIQYTWFSIAKEFLLHDVTNVISTLGAKVAFYANQDQSSRCSAFDAKVKDTTGAGDTFTGAYVSEYVRQKTLGKWDIRSAVIRAKKAAAMTVRNVGAQNGIPWSDEIDSFDALEKLLHAVSSDSTAFTGGDK
ncbi:unnamed protein product [Fusarium graminearum]|uniref:Carbohydrate kinase PfkB domain-containing protein n=1 Tax=Gibberella zeae TaxID=5518 RepID=A0A9N8RJZ6_GIBZA|nr:unnamed protein product [Fusarium graminearum]CAG1997549.1 unnamed protein product [Fusarium graminearum]